eukprot:sb/3468273/
MAIFDDEYIIVGKTCQILKNLGLKIKGEAIRSRALTPQHTHSVLLSGLSREPLLIKAWWTRRHALDRNRTPDLVRERRVKTLTNNGASDEPFSVFSLCARTRALTPQHTHSVLLSGLSREPLPIKAWWTRRHALDRNRTRDLVRERRVAKEMSTYNSHSQIILIIFILASDMEGSANINQRSMSGRRDTEIAIGACQSNIGSEDIAEGEISKFRKSLMIEHLNKRVDSLENYPWSEEAMTQIREEGERNWEEYSSDSGKPLAVGW